MISLWNGSIVLISSLFIFNVFLYYYELEQKNCRNDACINLTNEIFNSIDYSVNPCDDFYQFVCGNWIRHVQIPSELDFIDPMIIVKLNVEQQLGYVLDNSWDIQQNQINRKIIKSNSLAVEWAVKLYQLCKNTPPPKYSKSFEKKFYEKWSKLELPNELNWPIVKKRDRKLLNQYFDDNWIEIYAIFYYEFGFGPIFEFEVSEIEWDRDSVIFCFNRFILETSNDQQRFNDRPKELLKIIKTFYPSINISDEVIYQAIMEVIQMEKSILSAINDEIDDTELYRIQLKNLYNRTEPGNMTKFLNKLTLYSQQIKTNISTQQWTDEDFVAMEYSLEKLLPKTANECFEIMYDDKYELQFALARIWIDEWLKIGSKLKTIEMINYLKQAAIQSIKTNKWLDKQTKNRVIDKIRAIVDDVAFPEWILMDDELDAYFGMFGLLKYQIPDNYFDAFIQMKQLITTEILLRTKERSSWKFAVRSPLIVNAAYINLKNMIHIAASILNSPIFDPELPFYINYGIFGYVIAHEITHSLDENGMTYNKVGFKTEWWTNKSITKFENLTECFIHLYDEHNDQWKKLYNSYRTLGENIADNGGIRIAYQAYRLRYKRLKYFGQNAKLLPNLSTNFTIDQLFFISYARLFCRKETKNHEKLTAEYDYHSPNKYRVNIVLGNFEIFSKIFNCSRKSKLNFNQRCIMW
ncbi:endothelin-converting enzyme 1-like isoform X2 [Dermatophagoides pteronyssinus]|uniref:endothelin-converting enzyme 1-like isoform X2 n=1 Tax=Dermatophagoides pteronyssinus TaxID=6956 RepID=UPI003F67534B